ncbi:MAG TPA: hypothetical protein VNQ79_06730 [Blastocatellia bacterium]|nr:hypothetical protein [Blastocatellia bacterium]
MTFDEILKRFPDARRAGSEFKAHCPAHDDERESLTIRAGRETVAVLFCHAGCRPSAVAAARGLTMADLTGERNGHQNGHTQRPRITATYDYRDESGALLYQVCRFEPKDFRQRRPDGSGGWIWKLEDVRRVLYRLPELLASDRGEIVFIVEGEKDVEALRALGLTATCNVGGAGKWRGDYNRHLKGRRICLLPDNDEPGRAHARQVADALAAGAEWIKTLELPGLPEKGDVSDWLNAGGTRARLLDLAAQMTLETASSETESPEPALSDELPVIDVSVKDLAKLTAQAWAALEQRNDPPFIFLRAGLPVRLEHDDTGNLITRELDKDRMKHELARAAQWKLNASHPRRARQSKPPNDVVADVLATPEMPLPRLSRIVQAPVFAPDGNLQTTPGYHPASRNYYQPASDFRCLPVPDAPTEDDVERAWRWIDELLCDFPFATEADRTNAVALLLLPFVRDMIRGATPLHLIEASTPRTGKSLLASVLLYPGCGDQVALMPAARDDDDWNKNLVSAFRRGKPAIQIDNVNYFLDSASLCIALTEARYEGRILGKSELIDQPITNIWVMTANNPAMTGEIAGRTVRIRLIPGTDAPAEREGFRHPDLRQWVAEHRAELVNAAHILIQNWIARGRPLPKVRPVGSFEAWTRTIGGILEASAAKDFLANYTEFQNAANGERSAWRSFCENWWKSHGDDSVRVKDLVQVADQIDGFDLRGESERSQAKSLGKQLNKNRDSVWGNYRIRYDGISGGYHYWKLECLDPASAPMGREVLPF